jgi:hypothetical protein
MFCDTEGGRAWEAFYLCKRGKGEGWLGSHLGDDLGDGILSVCSLSATILAEGLAQFQDEKGRRSSFGVEIRVLAGVGERTIIGAGV